MTAEVMPDPTGFFWVPVHFGFALFPGQSPSASTNPNRRNSHRQSAPVFQNRRGLPVSGSAKASFTIDGVSPAHRSSGRSRIRHAVCKAGLIGLHSHPAPVWGNDSAVRLFLFMGDGCQAGEIHLISGLVCVITVAVSSGQQASRTE